MWSSDWDDDTYILLLTFRNNTDRNENWKLEIKMHTEITQENTIAWKT